MHERGAVPAPVHTTWASIIIPIMCYVVLYEVRRRLSCRATWIKSSNHVVAGAGATQSVCYIYWPMGTTNHLRRT